MKKLIVLASALVCAISLAGCGKDDTYKIGITIPAGTTGEFTYILKLRT